MTYLIIKALHIIFMVSYFAGNFYPRKILVYYKDTDAFESPKRKFYVSNMFIWQEDYGILSRFQRLF